MASSRAPTKVAVDHLPNVYRITAKVFSGGLPENAKSFQELQSLGVKTIVSVDGTKPNVELAKQYGLKYVHLPHGYDGISAERSQELAKAVRDLPGPIYIHCHHGKHRSPTAAAVACVGAGLLDPSAAVKVLTTAGTSEKYQGLYQSASAARPVERQTLDNLAVDFPEVAKLPPLAEAMVAIEHTHDLIKSLAKSQTINSSEQPDVSAAHEALLLKEQFAELIRTEEFRQRPEDYRHIMRTAFTATGELESLLANADKQPPPPAQMATTLSRLSQTCTDCHQRFRDNRTAFPASLIGR